MTTPQAGHFATVRLPYYKAGLKFMVEHVKINQYVRTLEWMNVHITFTRSEARACWLRNLYLEYKNIMDESMVDNGKLLEIATELYQKGVEQVSYHEMLKDNLVINKELRRWTQCSGS